MLRLTIILSCSPTRDPAHGALLKLLPMVRQADGLQKVYTGDIKWTTPARVTHCNTNVCV